MLEPHLPEIDINDLQLEVFRKQTLNLSTHLAVFELLCNAVVYCQLEVVFKLSQLNP